MLLGGKQINSFKTRLPNIVQPMARRLERLSSDTCLPVVEGCSWGVGYTPHTCWLCLPTVLGDSQVSRQHNSHRPERHTSGGTLSVGGKLETATTTAAETKCGPKRYDRDTSDMSTDGAKQWEDLQTGTWHHVSTPTSHPCYPRGLSLPVHFYQHWRGIWENDHDNWPIKEEASPPQ